MSMMLRAILTIIASFSIIALGPMIAMADDSGYSGGVAHRGDGLVDGNAQAPEDVGGEDSRGSSVGSTRVCTDRGTVIDCVTRDGVWMASRACYVSVLEPVSEGANFDGNESGYVMLCTLPAGGSYPFWQPTPELSPPPPDPRVLARRAVDSMQLRPIRMGTFPESSRATNDLGYVGWNMWMWVKQPDRQTWGPISLEASLDGYSVRATATVDRVVWDMGNGDWVTCQQGTPWRTIWSRNEPSPDCGYVYEQDGDYTVTATSHWVVEWSGIGETGTFAIELSESAPVRIAEVQVLNVPGR